MWPLNDSCYQGSWTRKSIECRWRGGINAGQIDHSISFSSWFDVPGHTRLIGPQTALNTPQEIPLSRKIQQASRPHRWQARILRLCWQLTLIKKQPAFFFFRFSFFFTVFHHFTVLFIESRGAYAFPRHREYAVAELIVSFAQFMGPSNCKNKYINHQNTLIDR